MIWLLLQVSSPAPVPFAKSFCSSDQVKIHLTHTIKRGILPERLKLQHYHLVNKLNRLSEKPQVVHLVCNRACSAPMNAESDSSDSNGIRHLSSRQKRHGINVSCHPWFEPTTIWFKPSIPHRKYGGHARSQTHSFTLFPIHPSWDIQTGVTNNSGYT